MAKGGKSNPSQTGPGGPFFLETGAIHGQVLSMAAPGAIRVMATLSHGLAIMGRQDLYWPPLGRPAEIGRDRPRREAMRKEARGGVESRRVACALKPAIGVFP